MIRPLPYALLAQAVYSCAPDIGIESSAARAIVRDAPDGKCVAIPGTDNIACWLADLDFEVVQTPLGGLHKGFSTNADAILAAVASVAPDVLCGHSEGADLALAIAGHLCQAGKPLKAVFAFEPAHLCIDDTLRQIFLAHGIQVLITRNGQDVVPIVPRLLQDWRHPWDVTHIGTATIPVPNVVDHEMARVLEAVGAYQA